jgi:hypothetical protein
MLFIRMMLAAVLITGFFGLDGLAQRGGKAEANRIKFARNANYGTVSGFVQGDEEAEYVFGAKGGQTITVGITDTPKGSVVVVVTAPDGSLVELDGGSATLPADGDFMLVVKKAKPSKGKSTYTVKLTIR